MIDYIFDNNPKFLLIDEIDKMASKDQTFLLNLMETGMVTETKHRKTRTITNVKAWVFATSNNVSKVMPPLQSRFFVVNLKPYTYEQLLYFNNYSKNLIRCSFFFFYLCNSICNSMIMIRYKPHSIVYYCGVGY
jgi:ATPase family associated with various cellular activities (AAA)